jgi:quercetin dioxygenase-like cupin family protein
MDRPSLTEADMENYVARFATLRGAEEAFIDSRLPDCKRKKICIIGRGVVEKTGNPDLAPNIPLSAYGFNLGMIQAEFGKGAALHAHDTEEAFVALVGAWEVIWLDGDVQRKLVLDPFDTIHVPKHVFRGFRYVGEGTGTLLTLIGGPDAGKVAWHPDVIAAAEGSGLVRSLTGELVEVAS